MTAVSLHASHPGSAEFGQRQPSAPTPASSRYARPGFPSSTATSPSRHTMNNPARQSSVTMSQVHPQRPEDGNQRVATNGTSHAAAHNQLPLRSNIQRRMSDSSPAPLFRRPSSAPDDNNQTSPGTTLNGGQSDDDDHMPVARPAKAPLTRSKSEYGLRLERESPTEQVDEEYHDWGARHGFEDHYQSEEVISQLANVR